MRGLFCSVEHLFHHCPFQLSVRKLCLHRPANEKGCLTFFAPVQPVAHDGGPVSPLASSGLLPGCMVRFPYAPVSESFVVGRLLCFQELADKFLEAFGPVTFLGRPGPWPRMRLRYSKTQAKQTSGDPAAALGTSLLPSASRLRRRCWPCCLAVFRHQPAAASETKFGGDRWGLFLCPPLKDSAARSCHHTLGWHRAPDNSFARANAALWMFCDV